MSDGGNGAIWAAVTAGVLAILGSAIGSVFQGYSNVQLEKAQLESRLILKALEPDDPEQRRNTLRFLVNTQLIRDPDIVAGLDAYTREEAPRSLPQVRAVGTSQQAFVPRDEADAGKTDVDLFLCGKHSGNRTVQVLREKLAKLMIDSGRFGHIAAKIWDGALYKEIPVEQLSGRITIVADLDHPEVAVAERIASTVDALGLLDPVAVVDNPGAPSPWRISVVLCPR